MPRNVSFWYHFDFLMSCLTPPYQAAQYYREGQYDTCSDSWNDFKKCLRAKVAWTDEDAEEIMKTMSYKQLQGDLNPSRDMWERKEKPSFF